MSKVGVFLGLLVVMTISTPAFAEDSANNFRDWTKNTELSCDTLIVLDYPNKNGGYRFEDGALPTSPKVDLSHCREKLTVTTFDKPLEPLHEIANDYDKSSTTGGLSDTEREALSNKEEVAMAILPKSIKIGLNPYVDYCRNLEPKPATDVMRTCYFGAPTAATKAPARALFEAMANNTLKTGALCAPDTLNKKVKMEPEFQSIIGATDKKLIWNEIRKSLSVDGYSCSRSANSDGCRKWILAININGKPKDSDQPAGIYGYDFISPRELSIYKGKWYFPGPYAPQKCTIDKNTKKETCHLAIQKRGGDEGICMVPEDWHTFIYVPILLNGVK